MKTISKIILLWMIVVTYSQAQSTLIPDVSFEQKLIALGIDTDGQNGQILNSDAQSVTTTLNLENSNITDLSGIEAFTNIDTLLCSSNSISSIDISNNPQLLALVAQNNQINTVDVSNNTALNMLVLDNNQLTTINISNNPNLGVFSAGQNRLASIDISNNILLVGFSVIQNIPNLSICVSSLQWAANRVVLFQKDPTAYYTENCNPLAITGKVALDNDLDCLIGNGDTDLTGVIVEFVSATDTFYFSTNQNGVYHAHLDTGTYSVSVSPPSPYYQPCLNSQVVVVDTSYTLHTLDWALTALVECPYLTVDIAAPFLRMTGGGSSYVVSYCNDGTQPAYNTYVEVDLDADLNFLSSSIPVANQTGQLYRFDLDTLDIGECGSFTIGVLVDTSSVFEQTHCTKVHIYPDSICYPVANVPIVEARANCVNNNVEFTIENKGATMLQSQSYTVIQDDVAMRVSTIQLNAGQSTIVSETALPGKTYRLEVDQVPNYPAILGDPVFSIAIEGCNQLPNGSFNTGFVTQFSNGLSQPSEAIDCQQNVASYDPNDKSAQPVGYGSQNYIYANTAIDYRVRFQNTGTDTAFNITILDTLSTNLDPSTLSMGSSSHNYTWSIVSGNVLRVDFANIMLPDSNVNEPLSNGFFRYRIEQVPNNPVGTIIDNQAAIYFDYNPPIFTNTTLHTVGEDFVTKILVSVDNPQEATLNVKVFPNPFGEETTLQIDNKHYEELRLEVYDLMGRKVKSVQAFDTNQVVLKRGNMEQGVYFYRLQGDQQVISTGKIQVKE